MAVHNRMSKQITFKPHKGNYDKIFKPNKLNIMAKKPYIGFIDNHLRDIAIANQLPRIPFVADCSSSMHW